MGTAKQITVETLIMEDDRVKSPHAQPPLGIGDYVSFDPVAFQVLGIKDERCHLKRVGKVVPAVWVPVCLVSRIEPVNGQDRIIPVLSE